MEISNFQHWNYGSVLSLVSSGRGHPYWKNAVPSALARPRYGTRIQHGLAADTRKCPAPANLETTEGRALLGIAVLRFARSVRSLRVARIT